MQTYDYAWAALWDTAIKFSLQSRAMTSPDHLAVGAVPEYIIKYDIDEDDDEWIMTLLKDLYKGDLILLN